MTDFRALCAKMAEDIRYLSECLRNPDDGHDPVCLSECESDYQEARAALAHPAPVAVGEVAELPRRPESFEFALDFLGEPENDELRAYVNQLEARAAELLNLLET